MDKRVLLLGTIAVALTVFLWSYFFALSNLQWIDFFSFDFEMLLQKVTSLNFVMFVLLFPITYGLIFALASAYEKKEAMVFSLAGALLGMLVATLLFQHLTFYWMPALFYLISLLVMIEVFYLKMSELKKLIFLRSSATAIQKSISVVGASLLVFSVITILPQQDEFIQKFEDMVFSQAFENMAEGSDLVDQYADAVVEIQKNVFNKIIETPQYQNLQDEEFKLMFEAMKVALDSEEYKEELKKALSQNQEVIGSSETVFEMIKERVPFIQQVENWLWLLNSFILMSLFLLLGGVIFTPLGAVYGLVFEKIIKKTS